MFAGAGICVDYGVSIAGHKNLNAPSRLMLSEEKTVDVEVSVGVIAPLEGDNAELGALAPQGSRDSVTASTFSGEHGMIAQVSTYVFSLEVEYALSHSFICR